MRLVLVSLLLTAAAASAQYTLPPMPGEDLPDAVLTFYLTKWEERMAKVNGLTTKCTLTETDGPDKRTFVGDIAVLRPNFVRLVLKAEDDPTNEKKWRVILVDGKDVWELDYRAKVARVHALPKEGVNHPAAALLLGGKAADLRKRYDLSVDPEKDHKEKNFVAIDIRPKFKEDEQDMLKAQLILWKNHTDEKYKNRWMLPARLWIQQPNKDQITWLFADLAPANLMEKDFAVPKLPAEWKLERQAAGATPVSRPK